MLSRTLAEYYIPGHCALYNGFERGGVPMMVFAFDRDWTVDVNPHPQHEAVPLAWVRHLAHDTDHEVWAIGNQDLKEEADIPGIEALAERYYEEGVGRLGEQNEFGRYEYWPERPDRLRILAEEFPDATECIVVDDIDLSDVEGWSHYYAWDFVLAVERGGIPIDPPSREE
ncbi:adaptin protein [Halococcus thailandensis JCM 13552]|uniref:Adaptin protein n=2 Tax=Halococcus thailandensis TaxID=335952 RepID=M0MUK7_9EURY|nr:adaptin protein [Halococcus thailandensis JCM 13552]